MKAMSAFAKPKKGARLAEASRWAWLMSEAKVGQPCSLSTPSNLQAWEPTAADVECSALGIQVSCRCCVESREVERPETKARTACRNPR